VSTRRIYRLATPRLPNRRRRGLGPMDSSEAHIVRICIHPGAIRLAKDMAAAKRAIRTAPPSGSAGRTSPRSSASAMTSARLDVLGIDMRELDDAGVEEAEQR
jgi:hypothetical protein